MRFCQEPLLVPCTRICSGHPTIEIIQFFGYPRSTIYNNVYSFRTVQQRLHAPARKSDWRDCTVRTMVVIGRAQSPISEDPVQSLQQLPLTVGVSEPTMLRITKEDL
ncbi:hypothetical protein J437_LFUL016421 [Ladona fulva]|uniref:Uncharacterized protein n=1 Tax=Ladona fulva TaxID=123851 RepID=A0A8K0PAP1_LADFU|nr:hypothetical protein J437_LFUL016421 [Ladona fulva]